MDFREQSGTTRQAGSDIQHTIQYRKQEAQSRRHQPNTETRKGGFQQAPRGGGRTPPAGLSFLGLPMLAPLKPAIAIAPHDHLRWGRAKGAAKASCAETVVQKGVFGESVFYSAPLRFSGLRRCFKGQTLRGQRRNGLSKNTLLDNRFCARRLRRSFGALRLEA